MFTKDYGQIIAACFPELVIVSCDVHSQGWDSVAVVVNNALIFRFPKRPDVEPQYQIERRLLPALATKLRIENAELRMTTQFSIPDVAFFWPSGTIYPSCFIGHHLIEGVPLNAQHLTPNHVDTIARQLGEFLSVLHRFPINQATRLGVPTFDEAGWRVRYQDQFAQIQSQVLPLLDEVARARIMRDWQAFLADKTHFQVALIHHDLADEHILYDPARGAISGIIDWGDTAIGDPAIDFTGLLAAYGEDFTERVLAHYQGQVDASFRDRMRFYRGVMPLNTVLFGMNTAQEEYVREGLAEYIRYERLEIRD
jgi:aminoglycoside 2''-phosphotransferase